MSSSSESAGDRFLRNLSAAIHIPTVSYDSPEERDLGQLHTFHRFLEDTYPLIHEQCQIETINEYSLLMTWNGSDPELDPIVVMAHHDVVPVEPGTEDDWPADPFSGEVLGDHLWGRGALDNKGPLIAILEATEQLLGAGFIPTRTVLIVSGHDEETGGMEGAKEIAETLRQRGVRPWFVLDEGGFIVDDIPRLSSEPVALVRTSEKGFVNLKLTARGEGGHSSAPKLPTTVGKLAIALKALEDNPLRARIKMVEPTVQALMPRLGPSFRLLFGNLRFTGPLVSKILAKNPVTEAWIRTTTAITFVSGGVKANVIPREATATVNFRIIPGDTVESVIAHVRHVVGSDIGIETVGELPHEASPVSSIESDAWNTLTSVVSETFPETIVAPWTLIAGTDARHFAGIAGDVYGFTPFTISLSDSERFHGTGERVRVRDAERAVAFFVSLTKNAAG